MKFSKLFESYMSVPDSLKVPQKKEVALVIGRFQPPHIGHLAVIKAASKEYPVIVGLTSGKKTEMAKNPFSFELRKDILKGFKEKALLDVIEIPSAAIDTIIELLRKNGYELKKIYCGSDRVKAYQAMASNMKYLEPYGITSPIEVEALERDPDADGVAGVSATKVRDELSKFNDKDSSVNIEKMIPNISKELLKELLKQFQDVK